MAIKLGSTDINSVNLGSVGLNRIYSGSDIVFGSEFEFGNALQFDGVNDYVTWTDAVIRTDSRLTISTFFKQPDLPVFSSNIPHILKLKSLNTSYGLRVFFSSGSANYDNISVGFENGSGSASLRAKATIDGGWAGILNTWLHLGITFDGVSTWKIYLNGTLLTTTAAGAMNNFGNTNCIGQINVGSYGFPFKGVTTEFAIDGDYEASAAEITDLANGAFANSVLPMTPSRSVNYRMNQSSGTSIIDESGNNYTGTLVNFTSPPAYWINY